MLRPPRPCCLHVWSPTRVSKTVEEAFDVALGGGPARLETRSAPARVGAARPWRRAHGWPDLARRAGGAGRHRDALEVERHQRRLGRTARACAKQSVFGRRSAASPKTTASGATARMPSSSRSRRRPLSARPRLELGSTRPRRRRRSRRSPATFSVPARAPLSWPPPRIERVARCRPRPSQNQGADALRAADLVARQREEVGAERGQIDAGSCRPPAPHRNADSRRAPRTSSATSATGWTTPVSLLASISETSGRAAGRGDPRMRSAQAARSATPSRVDRQRLAVGPARSGRRQHARHARPRRRGAMPSGGAPHAPRPRARAPWCWPRSRSE